MKYRQNLDWLYVVIILVILSIAIFGLGEALEGSGEPAQDEGCGRHALTC